MSALDNYGVFALKLTDEIKKNIFMGQQFLQIGAISIHKRFGYSLPLKAVALVAEGLGFYFSCDLSISEIKKMSTSFKIQRSKRVKLCESWRKCFDSK